MASKEGQGQEEEKEKEKEKEKEAQLPTVQHVSVSQPPVVQEQPPFSPHQALLSLAAERIHACMCGKLLDVTSSIQFLLDKIE